MVYDRLTPDGAAVALASYLARESAEGAPWLAIKPQWIPQPGSVLLGLVHLTELANTTTAHKIHFVRHLGLSLRGKPT